MKRITSRLPLIAITVAMLCSGFSSSKQSQGKNLNSLYWYDIYFDGIHVGNKLSDDTYTKAQAMVHLTICEDIDEQVCIVGSTNPNLIPGVSFIPSRSFSGDNHINVTEIE